MVIRPRGDFVNRIPDMRAVSRLCRLVMIFHTSWGRNPFFRIGQTDEKYVAVSIISLGFSILISGFGSRIYVHIRIQFFFYFHRGLETKLQCRGQGGLIYPAVLHGIIVKKDVYTQGAIISPGVKSGVFVQVSALSRPDRKIFAAEG